MKRDKQKKLKGSGWRVGAAKDFLDLSPEEVAYVELKFNLSQHLREKRKDSGLTQTMLAEEIGSSQSRIAKAEANDPSVSVDLLIRALFATGISQSDLAKLIAKRNRSKAA
jgi:DNA-binding XRE family transcriptional regulator